MSLQPHVIPSGPSGIESTPIESNNSEPTRKPSRPPVSALPDLRQHSHAARSPPCSPRRPGHKLAFKRVSVVSVLSGLSLPEDDEDDPAKQEEGVQGEQAEMMRSTVVFPRSVQVGSSAPGSRSASPLPPVPRTSSTATALAGGRPTSTVSLPGAISAASNTPPSPLARQRSVIHPSATRYLRPGIGGKGAVFGRTLSSPSVPSVLLRQEVLPSSATAAGQETKRLSSLTCEGLDETVPADNQLSQLSTALAEAPIPRGLRSCHYRPTSGPLGPDAAEVARRRLRQAEKKRKVIGELASSERAYVAGLEVVTEHFMRPLLAAVAGPKPILDKKVIDELFGPVLDIAAFSGALLEVLTCLSSEEFASSVTGDATAAANGHLEPAPRSPTIGADLGRLMPFLSLYHPFIANYPTASARLASLRKDPAHRTFAAWLTERERRSEAKKLRLGDWLLTVVQRVPRYLLLVKDLVSCTPEDDPEYVELQRVLKLVENVMEALNSRLHDIAATQELVGLHRAFAGSLPPTFSLVVPGRRLLKQGVLSKVGLRHAEDRTFWLFNDLLIYGTAASPAASTESALSPNRPPVKSTQSVVSWIRLNPMAGSGGNGSDMLSLQTNGSGARFVFHRAIQLEELTVVGPVYGRPGEDGHAFEILSPDKSFAVVCKTHESKDAWLKAIREAKTRLLADLRTLNTTEEHTMRRHRRRSLQAMPFATTAVTADLVWSSFRPLTGMPSVRPVSIDAAAAGPKALHASPSPTVESLTAAVWVPDAKAERCMRCREAFSVWRRRHHCRMCGVVCCHPCSSKAVQINDSSDVTSATHGARTCDACYTALFSSSIAVSQPGSTSTSSRPNSDHSSSTASDDRLPTPGDSLERLTNGLALIEQQERPIPSTEGSDEAGVDSTFSRTERLVVSRLPALGMLKASAARSAALVPFPRTVDSANDATLRPSRRQSISLGTLKALKSPYANFSLGLDGTYETGRPPLVSSIAHPDSTRRPRLLSATNDRFSLFIGGGIGGEDWAGRGEMATLASERARRESGERWGDKSLRSSEAAEHLRRVLKP